MTHHALFGFEHRRRFAVSAASILQSLRTVYGGAAESKFDAASDAFSVGLEEARRKSCSRKPTPDLPQTGSAGGRSGDLLSQDPADALVTHLARDRELRKLQNAAVDGVDPARAGQARNWQIVERANQCVQKAVGLALWYMGILHRRKSATATAA